MERGKALIWDFACADTLAASHLARTSNYPYAAPITSEKAKHLEYKNLENDFLFYPITYLFIQSQFGFRNDKSATLAINHLVELVTQGMDEGLDNYASFYDLTKASDCVSHEILLQNLKFYNFDGISVKIK